MTTTPIEPIAGACAWRGDELPGARWQRRLEPRHLAELDAALAVAKGSGRPPEHLTREDFPLAGTTALLGDIAQELEDGCGVVRLRGLPRPRYSEAELRLIFMGLCLHLGTPVHQNPEGQLFREIRDEGERAARYGQMASEDGVFLSSRARTASTAPLRFHTDRADVVALMCVNQARSGGLSRIASSVAVHNEMLARRPDLVELLYRDIHRSRLGEEEGGERMVYGLPVFGVRDGKFTSHYSRTYVEAAQRLPEVPRMSTEQWRALDLLDLLAEQLCFEMRLEPGDLQLVNNHVIYHARTAFENDPEHGFERVLYRVWLATPGSRALPEGHEVLWGDIRAGALRGGIALSPRLERAS